MKKGKKDVLLNEIKKELNLRERIIININKKIFIKVYNKIRLQVVNKLMQF